MKKRLVYSVIVLFLLLGVINSGCSDATEVESDTETEEVTVTDNIISEEVNESNNTDDDENSEEIFEPAMPIHLGIWSGTFYSIVHWYEFTDESSGKRYDSDGIEYEEFTYEVLDDAHVKFHYDDHDEAAHYSFGEDGKHVVLTFNDHQEKLAWVSHGPIDDIGELGLSFYADNITPTGCDVVCTQKGGSPSGKIVWDAGYSILIYDDESKSWGTTEVLMTESEINIDMDSTVTKHYDWSEVKGELSTGRYYIIFPVRDVIYQGGDWNSYQYKAEFTIE